MPFATDRATGRISRALDAGGRMIAGAVAVGAVTVLVPLLVVTSPGVPQTPASVTVIRPTPNDLAAATIAPPPDDHSENLGGGVARLGSVDLQSPTTPDHDKLLGWPVVNHDVSSPFGVRVDPINNMVLVHTGDDFPESCGDDVHAAEDGVVKAAGLSGDYGNRIVLKHEDRDGKSLETTYNHQSAILVQVGQTVKRGDVIGHVGTTGHSTGCHMHFEVVVGGAYTDPLPYLTGQPSTANLTIPVGSYMPTSTSTTASPSPSHTPSPSARPTEAPVPAPASESHAPSAPASDETQSAPATSQPTTSASPSSQPTTQPTTAQPTSPSSNSTATASAPPSTTSVPQVSAVFLDANGDGTWQNTEKQDAQAFTLTFTPASGAPVAVPVAADGTFKLTGLPDGTYMVSLPAGSPFKKVTVVSQQGAKPGTVVVAGGTGSAVTVGVQ